MTTRSLRLYSDLAIPPGETLAEEIEARGMTQKDLAMRLGRPAQVVNEIINAKKAITPETALGLETVLGISAGFWLNLEADYQLTLARQKEQENLSANLVLLKEFPVNEMRRRGWIESETTRISKLDALAKFFGTALPEPSAYQEAVGFRMTEAARKKVSLGALAAWLRQGEVVADRIEIEEFDASRFEKTLSSIRSMTEQNPQDFLPHMQSLCAEVGVALCVVPELPKSGANGVTRLLAGRKAVIQLSIRGKWADIFWFTFFHEACHVLRHMNQSSIIIQGDAADPATLDIEEEANRFAGDFLIPPERWAEFTSTANFDAGAVKDFAASSGIAPFIVVGRLQKERLVPYTRLSSLKVRYNWAED